MRDSVGVPMGRKAHVAFHHGVLFFWCLVDWKAKPIFAVRFLFCSFIEQRGHLKVAPGGLEVQKADWRWKQTIQPRKVRVEVVNMSWSWKSWKSSFMSCRSGSSTHRTPGPRGAAVWCCRSEDPKTKRVFFSPSVAKDSWSVWCCMPIINARALWRRCGEGHGFALEFDRQGCQWKVNGSSSVRRF